MKPGLTSNTVFDGSCTVETVNGSDRISWSAQDSDANYNVRRNGKWIRSTNSNTSFTNNGVDSGNYIVVARFGSNVAAGLCTRTGLNTIAPTGGCGLRDIDGDKEVTWTPQGNGYSYEVFRNGQLVGSTTNTWYWNRGETTGTYTVKSSNNTSISTMTCRPK